MQGSASQGFIRSITYGPDTVGLNSTTLASARDSNWVGCSGLSQVTIVIDLTRSATTTLTFQVQVRSTVTMSGITVPASLLDIAEKTAASGTVTTYDFTALTAASSTRAYRFTLPSVVGDELRIYQLTGTSAGSGDIVSAYITCQGVGG